MLDPFGRTITYMRLSVTELCNLRCRYCMPEEGVCKKKHEEILTEDEMITAVEIAAAHGVNKLRVTGGEPLIKPNLISIIRRAAGIEGIREIGLTTNGTMLADTALSLRNAGVSRVNISLDTLDPEKYAAITRRNQFTDVMNGIRAALDAGFRKIKINTVLIGGFNDDEIPALANLTREYPLDIRFIELMPMSSIGNFSSGAFITNETVLDKLPELERVSDDGVAQVYHLPGALGCVGLISPVSDLFCSRCNRIRLTADGKWMPCLHSKAEFPIKGLSREAMEEQYIQAIHAKPRMHGELSYDSRSGAARDMNQIGG